ncbi:MAG TPA: hypothetical protein VFX70_09355 [Mycobacteriales bacterium]|nr:hypothetical protein [Mycobacteriales bacterium]
MNTSACAARLRVERARRGWTRNDTGKRMAAAARSLGISGLPDWRVLAGYTHKWEKGRDRPSWRYQVVLAAVFGLSVRDLFGSAAALEIPPVLDAATGGTVEVPHFAQAEDDPVQRRKLLAWLAALAAGTARLPAAVRQMATVVGDRPDLLPAMSMDDVANLDASNAMFTTWEWTVGGAVSRQAAMAHVSWALAQLDARVPAPPDVRDAWRVSTARLAQTAGWMCHDAGREAQSRGLLVLGYQIASTVEQATSGDPARVFLLTHLAHQAIDVGRPKTGLDLVRHAQTVADAVAPTARYRLYTLKARAYAAMGDERAMRRELGLAETEFSHAGPDDLVRSPWDRNWQSEGQYHYNIGTARQLLAGANPDAATAKLPARVADEFIAGSAAWGPHKERDRTSARLRAATLLMTGRDHEHAVAVAREALPALPALRSHRIDTDVATLRAATAPFRANPDVAALVHDLPTP